MTLISSVRIKSDFFHKRNAVIHTVEKHKARNKDYALKKFIKYKDAFLFFYKFFSSFQKIRC